MTMPPGEFLVTDMTPTDELFAQNPAFGPAFVAAVRELVEQFYPGRDAKDAADNIVRKILSGGGFGPRI